MALAYKLEYNIPASFADESVYIHLKEDPPSYISQVGKEDYQNLSEAHQSDFVTGLFNIKGVVEVAVQAHRIWIMKSPVYSWAEVNTPLLAYLADQFSQTSTTQLPGSAQPDGSGFRIDSEQQRRGR